MNFDIKYATYLQIFNFIKIKQSMDIVPGTQSGEAKERDLNRHGYKSEMVSKQADRWSLRRLANQKDALPSLSFNLTSGTHLSLTNQ